MESKEKSSSTSNSGIRKLATGESIIPASTRADGSVRKEIRVKPGYKPPEDVEKYKNRTAEAWKNRGKGGVLGAEAADSEEKDPSHKAASKNAKRREARKKAAAAGGHDEAGEREDVDDEPSKTNGEKHVNGDAAEQQQEVVDPEVEKTREARKLSKKLRQAKELQEKKDKGDNLLPEQFAKVIKINELIRQLDSLGFDADGEKKTKTEVGDDPS